MVVGVGVSQNIEVDKIEIIDLESSTTICNDMTNFPVASQGSFGALVFQSNTTFVLKTYVLNQFLIHFV
jgi:hypothetical protein